MSVYLRLEIGAGGTPLEAIEVACRASDRVGVNVILDVNGVEVLIMPGDLPRYVHASWSKALERGAKFAASNVTPRPPQ